MVCSHLYAGFRPWKLKSLRSMEFIRWYKFKNLSQWGTRPEVCEIYIAVPHVLFLALSFTLLPRFSSLERFSSILTVVFFSRFSSFERLPSITVVFPRTFHHLYASLRCFTALFVMWTLLFNNSSVWTLLFHISCVRCTFHRLQIFPLFLSFTLSLCFAYKFHSPPPPPLVWSQVRLSVFFILCAHFPQFKFFSRLLSFTPVASLPVLTLS